MSRVNDGKRVPASPLAPPIKLLSTEAHAILISERIVVDKIADPPSPRRAPALPDGAAWSVPFAKLRAGFQGGSQGGGLTAARALEDLRRRVARPMTVLKKRILRCTRRLQKNTKTSWTCAGAMASPGSTCSVPPRVAWISMLRRAMSLFSSKLARFLDLKDALEELLERSVDLVDRKAIEASRNTIRGRRILAGAGRQLARRGLSLPMLVTPRPRQPPLQGARRFAFAAR